MAGSNPPRDFREWQQYVNRYLSESRRGPAQLVAQVTARVEQQEQALARVPAAPVEIQYQTAFYQEQAQYSGYNFNTTAVRLVVDFPDVTRATDGKDITVDGYQLWTLDVTPHILDRTTSAVPGIAVPGMTAPSLVATEKFLAGLEHSKPVWVLRDTSTTSSFRAEPFIPGHTYKITIRAISTVNGLMQLGKFSEQVEIYMEKDDTPPPQPTAPRVVAERGQFIVTWDGQAVTGAMPGDFSYAVLSMGSASSPTQEVARFGRGGGTYIAANMPYYDPQFFRVQAFDETGNASPWSEQGFNYVQPLVDEDVILSTIDAAKTHLKNVDAGVSILPDTIITEHLHVTEDMSAAMGQFLHLKAGQIDVNDLWADNAFFGLADAKLVRSDMFLGKAFVGGQFTLTEGGKFQTNPFDNRGVKVDENGIHAWNPVGTMTVDISSVTGDAVLTGTYYPDLTGSRVRISDRDTIGAIDIWADDTSNHGAFFMFHNPELAVYATQLTHFTSASNTVPASYIQLSEGRISLRLGDYQVLTHYIVLNNAAFDLQHPTVYFWAHSTDAYWGHKGDGTIPADKSNPYIRLTQGERRIVLSTSALASDANNYGMIQVTPAAVFSRQANGNTTDLTLNSWAARLSNNTSWLYQGIDSFETKVAKGSRIALFTNGNWQIGHTTQVDTFGRGRIEGGQDQLLFYPTGSGGAAFNWFYLRHDQPAQLTGGMNLYGNFNVYSGTKNFVMPHPTKIGMELVHAATESPYSGIEDWGSGTLNEDGYWIVELPEYFEPIAAQDHRLVKVYSPTGAVLTWTEIMDGQFMVEGEPGTPFGWEVKARREGYDVEVEKWVDDRRNAGEPRAQVSGAGGSISHENAVPNITTLKDGGPRELGIVDLGDEIGNRPAKGNRGRSPKLGAEDSLGRYHLGHARGSSS